MEEVLQSSFRSRFTRREAVSACAVIAAAPLFAVAAAASLPTERLRRNLQFLAATFDGRVGIAVRDSSSVISIHGKHRFPLQSVMKLVVAAAVLDAVDRGRLTLETPVVVHKEDLSLNVQPLARLVTDEGFHTTLGDLVFRAVVDSDSAAADILFARAGGAAAIGKFLVRAGIDGIRIDRDERHLQTEILGLTWRPEFVDTAAYTRAKQAVPERQANAAFQAYLSDPRDTSTPDSMALLLHKLAAGELLSPQSTRHLLNVMGQTTTFPDRLKAGVPSGWQIGHKTGTSHTWRGVNGVTNDVGILTAPDGHTIAVAVFLAASRRTDKQRAALIANVARMVTSEYRRN